MKQRTIPHLELTAATVAVRLGCLLRHELDIQIDGVLYYTDSTTVLHYLLNKKKRFSVFIGNRVQFILDFTDSKDWRYINSKNNPADCASRGMQIQDLLKTDVWLSGPTFLWKDETTWDLQPLLSKDYAIAEEETTSATVIIETDTTPNATDKLIGYFSTWFRLKYAVAVYRKLIKILADRKTKTASTNYQISVTDIAAAEKSVIRYVQRNHFGKDVKHLTSNDKVLPKDSHIFKLDPYMEEGLLRVGGRLDKSSLPDCQKHPILLPKNSHVTSLIIRDIHSHLAHAGRNHVLAQLRETF